MWRILKEVKFKPLVGSKVSDINLTSWNRSTAFHHLAKIRCEDNSQRIHHKLSKDIFMYNVKFYFTRHNRTVACLPYYNFSVPENSLFTRRSVSPYSSGFNNHLRITRYQNIHTSYALYDVERDKSKVEQTVESLKESMKTKKDVTSEVPIAAAVTGQKPETSVPATAVVKKSIGDRIMNELRHYYHGFRLLFIDISISAKLAWRVLRGKSLSRREHKLLIRTVSDIFRLVPFSVFIIVPFMEFLLPFFIKFFPNMLPSTFQSKDAQEVKMKKTLKVKLEMAKFLQDTLDEMALQTKGDKRSETAKDFSLFFENIRKSGVQASNEEIIKFSKLFEDEITLDSLSRDQLVALCKLLEMQSLGTTAFLRFQLRMRLRNLVADDKIIRKEGIESMNTWELQQACKARGMRAYGVSEVRLQSQLSQWLELSLDAKIPPSLLLLSRALYIPETLPQADQLKAAISILPAAVGKQTKAKIGEMEGKVDNRTKIEIIREEEKMIKEEKEEKIKLEETKVKAASAPEKVISDALPIKELIIDIAPVIKEGKVEELSHEDLDVIEDALENIAAEKKQLLIEKEELEDLKEEMQEYKEDIEELKDVKVLSGVSEKILHESKAANRLFKHVNRMIGNLDQVVSDLESKGVALKEKIADGGDQQQKYKNDIVTIDELLETLKKMQSQPEKLEKIMGMLEKLDVDQDGALKVDDILDVIELVGKDQIKLSSKQVDEIVELLEKEENLESEEKLEKTIERKVQQEEIAKVVKEEKQN